MLRLGWPCLFSLLSACVATVPRPEPLAEEPLTPEDARTSGPVAPRPPRERPTRACLPKALAEQGRVTHARLTSPKLLSFCMRPEGASDDTPDGCFEWNLENHAFRLAPALEPLPPPEAPAPPPSPKIDKAAVSLCDAAGKCALLVAASALPRTEQYRREADQRLFARVSADGKLVALVRQRAGGDDAEGQVEVWSLEQKKRLKLFKVTSAGHGDQIAGLRFLGPMLLVEQCDAGPACTGRLFDPATGKARLDVPINFFGAELFPLDAGRWLFVDGWLRGAAIVDVATAAVVAERSSGASGPAEDSGRVLRLDSGELLFVLSGSGEGPEHAGGGTLIRLDPSQTGPARRFAPPGCAE